MDGVLRHVSAVAGSTRNVRAEAAEACAIRIGTFVGPRTDRADTVGTVGAMHLDRAEHEQRR